ncbi:MAG TPA: M28 family peptidase, partial [Bryobacteraceae bacterium]|nr:M28 family peptidase [Bryobacteraceae bacterium]
MSLKLARRVLPLLCLAVLPRLSAQGLRIEFTANDRLRQRLAANPEKNKARMETLEALFAESGCKDRQLQRQSVRGHALPNVICTLPGTGEGTVVVGAHFDHVEIGSGAVDNWSGASLLPSLYEGLAKSPRTLTFVFAGFTEEESGLNGSRYFVQQWKREKRPLPLAMINIDTIGLTPTKVGVSTSDKRLVDILWRLSQAMKLPLMGMNAERVGTSDHEEFANAKI